VNYTVSLDGVVVGTPTGTSQTVTFPTAGNHTLTLTATNTFGTSAPATLTVNVIVPGKPANLRLQ
jgi:PKD repeat protein